MADLLSFQLGEEALECSKLMALAAANRIAEFNLSPLVCERLAQYRLIVDDIVGKGDVVYGINTGFGFLSNVRISPDRLSELQVNLIRSHACGVGDPLAEIDVRSLLILRAHTFCLGHSGIRRQVVETIIRMINSDVLPVIPSQGSVGASGDLAPLAHLAQTLMGEGQVTWEGRRYSARDALAKVGIEPLVLEPKEGISLINGTHVMTALGARAVAEARILSRAADTVAAMSIDALRGTTRQFDHRIHEARPQVGQGETAANFRSLFAGADEIMASHADCDKVQDPYSLRCIPQVHGAAKHTIKHVQKVINAELNSVTDNPLCFLDGQVISGGNFHGQPIAMALDFLAIAMSELGSMSERRIEKITNPALSGLPPFVTNDGGVNSGFMIPHVVAAALASENKTLAVPASVDSIPTSADKEDHVSMGPISARQVLQVNKNISNILAIELLSACQGIDMLRPLKPNKTLQKVYEQVRALSPEMTRDRSLSEDIGKVSEFILQGNLDKILAEDQIILDEALA